MSRKLRDGGSSGSEDFVLINLKEQVKAMLDQAFGEEHYENTILHSDQDGNINTIFITGF